ncbi:MAG: response regulator [Elusimicrobiota bacterium]
MTKPDILLAVDRELRSILEKYLVKFNFRLSDLETIEPDNPDLVVFTEEYAAEIKKFISGRTAFIMIIGTAEEEMPIEGVNNLNYLRKPFTWIEFSELVRKNIVGYEWDKEDFQTPESGRSNYKEKSKRLKKIILIADDDIEARCLANVLLKKKYDIVEAEDGKMLVKQAPMINPDLIISDIVMPGLSGWRAVKKIRENPLLQDVPVIFYSSLLKDYELYHILKPGGPSDFIYKPYTSKDMLEKVSKMLKENG